MNYVHLGASAAVMAIVAASPAAADITAPQLWDQWQAMTEGMGPEVPQLTAEGETYQGGVLTLDGLGFTMTLPDGTATGRIDRVVMTEQTDGTVAIDYQGEYLLDAAVQTPEGEPIDVSLGIGVTGLDMVATADEHATVYDYTMAALEGNLKSLTVNGVAVPSVVRVSANSITGTYTVEHGDPVTFDSAYSIEEVTALLDFSDPEDSANRVKVTAGYRDIEAGSAGAFRDMFMLGDADAMLSGDTEMSGGFSHSGGSFEVDGNSVDAGAIMMSASSAAGAMEYRLTSDTMDFSTSNTGVAAALSGDGIPMPELTASAEELQMSLQMPLTRSDEMKDFGLLLNLGGLGVSEMLWSVLDPSGSLPRDPATLLVDLGGRMRLTADLTDEAAMNAPVPPFDFEVLTLKDLRLAVAGAELTGVGGLDFGGAPEGALPGMPGVEGDVILKLAGGNGLVQKLVTLGLVPQTQAIGFQMMLGMFATPVGDDVVESRIELGPDGSIIANGAQLR